MSYNYAANETEKALVATVINYPEKLDYLELSPDDFTNKDYALIYQTAQSLRDKGYSVNIPVIIEKLHKRIPKDRLVEACNTLNAMPHSVESIAQVIRNNAVRRRMKEVGRKIMDLADNAEDVAEAIAEVEKEVSTIDIKRGKGGLKHIEYILEGAYDDLNARAKSKDSLTGISTGFLELDAYTAGWQKGDLVIIGARPSMGKSALMLQLAANVAKKGVAAVFSLEMSAAQLRDRLLAAEGPIQHYAIRSGRLGDKDWERLSFAIANLEKSGMYIDDTSEMTIPYFRAELRRLRRQVGDVPLVAFVDYLQLVRVNGRSRVEELAEVTKSFKAVAKELDATVIALCQLSRKCEERQDKRPLLSDIRESGNIEQDADLVIFLYRDKYYNPDTEAQNIAELIIAKQRNGPVGTAKLGFFEDTQRFVDLSQRSE
jgi:replicative DNA helicase